MPRRLFFLLAGLLLLIALNGQTGVAQGPNKAGLVLQFGNGEAVGVCVSFDEQSISGYELLRRSGMSVIIDGDPSLGAAVCRIGDAFRHDGCDFPADDCFCQCTNPATCRYWAYHHLQNGAWVYADAGASSWQIRNGMVDGWGFGLGAINTSGVQPPILSFEQICFPNGTPTPTVTPLPGSTSTPTPTTIPTATPTPTATVTGSVTFTPTPTPTGSLTATPTPSFTPTLIFTLTPTPLRTSTPIPSATPSAATPAGITASLVVEPESISAGGCATLRWRVEGASSVFLQTGDQPEQSVALSSALSVCPSSDTLYNLRAVQGANQQRASTYLEVLPATDQTTPTGNEPTPIEDLTIITATLEVIATAEQLPVETSTPAATTTIAPVVAVAPPSTNGQVAKPVPIFTPAPIQRGPANVSRLFVSAGVFALVLAAVIAAGAWALLRQRPG